MKKFNKFFGLTVLLLTAMLIVSCGKPTHRVTFDSQGGSAVATITVASGKKVDAPAEPTKDDYVFVGWYQSTTSDVPFNFDTLIDKDITLYARWLGGDQRFIRFIDHRQNKMSFTMADSNNRVAAPTNPTRANYRFGGWFTSKRGLVWNETAAFDFSKEVPEGGLTLYTYWEPVNSVLHNWSAEETYFSTLSNAITLVFNPTNYIYADEIDIIETMATLMYYSDVDWDKAIEEGIADYPGDFSKTIDGTYHIDSLESISLPGAAAGYPKNSVGDDLVDQETGKWDQDGSVGLQDFTWTVKLRNDLKFADGTPITAHDYVYSFKQYVDPKQNNSRGSSLYPSEDRTKGYPLVNLRNYVLDTNEDGSPKLSFDEVGMRVIDNYTLEFTFEENFTLDDGTGYQEADPVSQSAVMSMMNYVKLLHPTAYAASLDSNGVNSNYGTPLSPYVSYGGYVIKAWSENQKLIFNKNYEYVLKQNIHYKSMSYQYTNGPDENAQLFKNGEISAFGLTGEYVKEYDGSKNNKTSWSGFPWGLELNVTDVEGRDAQEIVQDVNFRKAFLFGFDRNDFCSTVFAPNTPSIMMWPVDGKHYADDLHWYSESDAHNDVLEALGINKLTNGYDQAKAVNHFMTAWTDNGSVLVTIDFAYTDTPLNRTRAQYIEEHYEKIFNHGGVNRIDIVQRPLESNTAKNTINARTYDLTIDSTGWGTNTGTWFYTVFKGVYYGNFYPGMNVPAYIFDKDGKSIEDADVYQPLDLRDTYEHLKSTKGSLWNSASTYGIIQEFYDHLEENDGYYKGKLQLLGELVLYESFLWNTGHSTYAGAVNDINTVTAAFEYAILDFVTLIPVATSTSVTTYASNVIFEWPDYSYEFGWGPQRYRYLNTDPDFK